MKLVFDEYNPPGGKKDIELSPVILLHAKLDSRRTWKRLAPEIAEKTGRTVYAYDARNHGESPWTDEMDIEILANDLGQFLDEHSIQRAVLVGHSMGGRTAINFSLQRPERVEKLFVEDMIVYFRPKAGNIVVQMIHLMRKSLTAIPPDADEMTAKTSVVNFMKKTVPPGSTTSFVYEAESLPLKKVGREYTWQANLDVIEDVLKNRQYHKTTGAYNGPTLFLYGNKSFCDVENDESIPKHFPRATKVCVEGAGHLIHQDFPEEFLKELLKFV